MTDTTTEAPTDDVFEEYDGPEGETPETDAPATEAEPSASGIRDGKAFAKGTWQAALVNSARLQDRSGNDRKRASTLLWQGARAAIAEWETKSDVDVHAENLYDDVLTILGVSRKGDVSKIKTVALAVKNAGLVLGDHPNLSKAYAEARRLTVGAQQERAEDDAADVVIEKIAENAPASTTTVDGAAQMLLAKGIDGAVVAILDALNGPAGEHNEAAHRSFMRAVASEVAARVQAAKPKPEPKPDAPVKAKAPAKKATPAKKAAPKSGADKAKTPAKKSVPAKKATPVSASKGDPNAKALPPKETTAPVVPAKKATPVPVRR